jgi:hypothetical protein
MLSLTCLPIRNVDIYTGLTFMDYVYIEVVLLLKKQDRQATYNVKLRFVRTAIVAEET